MLPKRKSEHIVVQELEDELMVLDVPRNRAHCLNREAAAVWRACDGTRSIAEIEVVVRDGLGASLGESRVAAIVAEIDRARLLEVGMAPQISRRAAVAATAGLAATVATMLLPTAALAAGSNCAGLMGPCSNSSECCRGLTCSAPAPAAPKVCH